MSVLKCGLWVQRCFLLNGSNEKRLTVGWQGRESLRIIRRVNSEGGGGVGTGHDQVK